MGKKEIYQYLNLALKDLFSVDSEILTREYNLNERSISHRLAMFMCKYFEKGNVKVDVEYNRMRKICGDSHEVGDLMGKIINFEDSGEGERYVYPDIIVHERDQDNNLLIVEIKMSWKKDKKNHDYNKINGYLKELNYKFGAYVEIAPKLEDCEIEFGPFKYKVIAIA